VAVVFGCFGYALLAAADGRPPLDEVVEPVDSPFAVVELFTSEGCSSCPPADLLLVELSARSRQPDSRLYPLTFHVDYWDKLGWPDRFADELWSERQRRYALAWRTSRVFTPQAVVNGHDSFVGSRRGRLDNAIEQALQRPAEAKLALEAVRERGLVQVQFDASGRLDGAVLQIALVQEGATSEVARGENRGRTLRHANVVRELQTVIPGRSGWGRVELPYPADLERSSARVVAFVQDAQSMAIRGAAAAELREG